MYNRVRKLPNIHIGKTVAIVCEGYEEFDYITRLIELKVWNDVYKVVPYNAKSIDNISAVYQNVYQNGGSDVVLIFCDTEAAPYTKFELMRKKVNAFHDKNVADAITVFANPCTMQIVLSHFAKVKLHSNQKTDNAPIIRQHTGVGRYHAEEKQRAAIMRKITADNYEDMKNNVKNLDGLYRSIPSTNAFEFFSRLETVDTSWIDDIDRAVGG